jgi:hypothetical protein
MDTTTLSAIMEMIEIRIINLEGDANISLDEFQFGTKHLQELHQHLQGFIEGQLNAAENETHE